MADKPDTADTPPDAVDIRRAQWAREAPDIDTEPMEVLGRIWRIANLVAPGIEATFASFGAFEPDEMVGDTHGGEYHPGAIRFYKEAGIWKE